MLLLLRQAASEFADGKLTASTVVLAPCSITQEGTIEIEDSDLFVVCPYHSFDFSLTTGQCGHAGSGSKLEACVWPVRVEGPDLWIEMDQEYELFSLRAVNPNFAATAPSPVSASALPQEDLPESATVTDWIHRIMSEPNGKQKVALTRTLVQRFRSGQCTKIGKTAPPDVPARESSLKSVDPSQVSKRGKGGSERSRIAILHALANIELYAIDLALDVLARFPTYHGKAMPLSYFMDFLKVAEDEAKHYTLLCERLEALGSYFGALPVHSGLWTSAQQTKDDLLERISIVNLVHESRGLDTNPGQIQKFKNAGDKGSEEVLTTIHHDEVTHVATQVTPAFYSNHTNSLAMLTLNAFLQRSSVAHVPLLRKTRDAAGSGSSVPGSSVKALCWILEATCETLIRVVSSCRGTC